MSTSLRDVLRERAEVGPAQVDAAAIMREGDRRIRRRRLAGVAAAVGVVATVLAGTLLAPRLVDAGPSPATHPPATPVESLPDGHLPAGRYSLEFPGAGPDAPVAQVEVPRGFETYNGNVLWAGGDGSGALMFWTVARLPRDPCQARDASFYEPGPSVEDLADALLAQEGRRGSRPEPVSLEGYDGLYLEFRVPETLVPEDCFGGNYDTWTAISGLRRYQTPAGSRDRIWILDADGQRLVVNLVEVPGNPANEDLEAMFDSLELVGSA